MLAKASEKKFFAIIGMPSSGSTLICKYFNSIENSICISEPFSNIKNKNFNITNSIKLSENTSNPREFIQSYKDSILNSNFNFGGFKEVTMLDPINPHNRWNYVIDNFDLFDFIILIIRNPLDNINSIRHKENIFGNHSIEKLCNNFKYLISLLSNNKLKDHVYAIDYDIFCKDKNNYINKVFLKHFTVSDQFKLIDSNGNAYIAANGRGKVLNEIINRKLPNILSSSEIEYIKLNVMDDYKKINFTQ